MRVVLQVAMLLAWAMPMVAAVTVWKWLFDWRTGVVNWLLVQLGADRLRQHNWLAQPLSFFFVATVIIVWMSVPFVALSVFAALTQVPDEVVEAARIDGAGPSQTFRWITVPMIRPVLAIVLLLQIIWDLRVFAQIRLLQDSGAPVAETNLLGNFIFELGIGRQDFAAPPPSRSSCSRSPCSCPGRTCAACSRRTADERDRAVRAGTAAAAGCRPAGLRRATAPHRTRRLLRRAVAGLVAVVIAAGVGVPGLLDGAVRASRRTPACARCRRRSGPTRPTLREPRDGGHRLELRHRAADEPGGHRR